MEGFDFGFTPEGELIIDEETHDILKVDTDRLKVQLSYNRIKSIAHNWFVDEVGADLEELIGWKCNKETAEYGKEKIKAVLLVDGLWEEDDIYIKSEIVGRTEIDYNVFLRLYQNESEEPYSVEIDAELDLIKGVHIRYGWWPRHIGWPSVHYKKDW